MKKLNPFKVGIVVIGASCGLLYSANAQPTNPDPLVYVQPSASSVQLSKVPNAPASVQYETVVQNLDLYYVRPDIMAYLLDPKNQPAPGEFRNDSDIYLPEFRKDTTASSLKINPMDAQKQLQVFSTKAGLKNVAQNVAALDKPIMYVLRLVSVDTQSANAFWGQLPGNTPNLTFGYSEFSTVSDNFNDTLHDLIAAHKASVVNTTVFASPAKEMAVPLTIPFPPLKDTALIKLPDNSALLWVTSTLNADNQVQFAIEYHENSIATRSDNPDVINMDNSSLKSKRSIESGQTLALTGLDEPLANPVTNKPQTLILFMTGYRFSRSTDIK